MQTKARPYCGMTFGLLNNRCEGHRRNVAEQCPHLQSYENTTVSRWPQHENEKSPLKLNWNQPTCSSRRGPHVAPPVPCWWSCHRTHNSSLQTLESHLRSWGSWTTASPANLSWSWWRWSSCPALPFHLIYPLVLQLLKKKIPQDRQLWWRGLGKAGSGLTNSTTTQAQQTQGFEWPTPASSHLGAAGMCEGAGPVDPIAAGSLWLRATANYLQVSMWVQYWCCGFRSQRLSTSLMTHCNRHSQGKLFGLIWCVTHQSFQCHYNGRVCDGDAGETRSGMVCSQNTAAETGAGHCGGGGGGSQWDGFFCLFGLFSSSFPFLIFNFLILIFLN